MLLEDPPAVAVADMLPEIYLETRPPQAVGPVHRPLESFIFIYIPSFQTPLNN